MLLFPLKKATRILIFLATLLGINNFVFHLCKFIICLFQLLPPMQNVFLDLLVSGMTMMQHLGTWWATRRLRQCTRSCQIMNSDQLRPGWWEKDKPQKEKDWLMQWMMVCQTVWRSRLTKLLLSHSHRKEKAEERFKGVVISPHWRSYLEIVVGDQRTDCLRRYDLPPLGSRWIPDYMSGSHLQ